MGLLTMQEGAVLAREYRGGCELSFSSKADNLSRANPPPRQAAHLVLNMAFSYMLVNLVQHFAR